MNRRELLSSITAAFGLAAQGCRNDVGPGSASAAAKPIRLANGDVDWRAVRELSPLAPDWTHLASFLFSSHPKTGGGCDRKCSYKD